MNIVKSKCKFNLGIEMEASGSKTDKLFNIHFYFINRVISISPTNKYIPLRFAFGSRSVKGNLYINFGFLDWNLLLNYRSKELVRRLKLMINNPCIPRLSASMINIGKV